MKIEIEVRDIPFFKLSTSQDLILYLIKKELQDNKLAQEFDRLGFDSMLFSMDLGDLILSFMGFQARGDKFWNDYQGLVHIHAAKVDLTNPETASEQALELYLTLREKIIKPSIRKYKDDCQH